MPARFCPTAGSLLRAIDRPGVDDGRRTDRARHESGQPGLLVDVSADGTRLLVSGNDAGAWLYRVSTGELAAPPLATRSIAHVARFGDRGALVVACGTGGDVHVWTDGGERGAPILPHNGACVERCSCATPDSLSQRRRTASFACGSSGRGRCPLRSSRTSSKRRSSRLTGDASPRGRACSAIPVAAGCGCGIAAAGSRSRRRWTPAEGPGPSSSRRMDRSSPWAPPRSMGRRRRGSGTPGPESRHRAGRGWPGALPGVRRTGRSSPRRSIAAPSASLA